MKIEIGESLVASWLKHIHHCSIVETNWKVASSWNGELDPCLTHAFEQLKNEFGEKLFKKNSSLSQVLKQSEVDVVGYNFKSGQVFMVEVAFHENGLNYGSTEKTILNVLKKLIRAVFLWYIYFREEGQLIPRIAFVTPKSQRVHESAGLFESLEKARVILEECLRHELNLEFISNRKFFDEVFSPVVALSMTISDSNELFLRSYQLIQLVEKHRASQVLEQLECISDEIQVSASNEIDDEVSKVKRKVPGWFQRTHQINSLILLGFLQLQQNSESITIEDLSQYVNVRNFHSNFNQMCTISERNHAKVFQVHDDVVELWEPVTEFIKGQYASLRPK